MAKTEQATGNTELETGKVGEISQGTGTTGNDPETTKQTGQAGKQESGTGTIDQEPIKPTLEEKTSRRKPRAKKSSAKLDLSKTSQEQLARQICAAHGIVDAILGSPGILPISEDESAQLIVAVTEVMKQYKIKPNPKMVAWCQLCAVAGVLYVPRGIAMKNYLKTKRSQKQQQVQPNFSQPVDPQMYG